MGDNLLNKLPKINESLNTPYEIVTRRYIWGSGFSETQVRDEVKKIDVKKSSGFQEIDARCLKMC